MCIRFADMETKLGEIDRARAIYGHCSQLCDPRVRSLDFSYLDVLEYLGDDDIALGPHLEVKTCDLVRCRRLKDLLVLRGTTKSTRKKSQKLLDVYQMMIIRRI